MLTVCRDAGDRGFLSQVADVGVHRHLITEHLHIKVSLRTLDE
jgi:hypothetical protein